jgi:hypothetical protein
MMMEADLPSAWEHHQRLVLAAAILAGLTPLTFTLAATETALAAIKALSPEKPRLRLICINGETVS